MSEVGEPVAPIRAMIVQQQIWWRPAADQAGRWGGGARWLSRGQALLAGLLLGLATVPPAAGQLAITEAMSAASTNSLADFWELTNFGTNDISLAGFIWSD